MNKNCTSIEQSKMLAEILPLESADMWWAERYAGRVENYEYIVEEKPVYYLSFTKPSEENYSQDTIKDIPCWSLAALLSVLPRIDIEKEIYSDDTYEYRVKAYIGDGYVGDWFDNPIDACYDMIIKLHEDKLL